MISSTCIVLYTLILALAHDAVLHSFLIASRILSIFCSYEATAGEGRVSSVHVAAYTALDMYIREIQKVRCDIFRIVYDVGHSGLSPIYSTVC